MRMSRLLGAAIALSMLAPIAPAVADVISPGNLMYTDLYRWQGQYGTPTWRQILAEFDCTAGLTFYLWNVPSPPPPVIIAPPPAPDPAIVGPPPNPSGEIVPPDPSGAPGGDSPEPSAPGGAPGGDPTGTPGLPGGDPPRFPTPVPEPSTWAMLLIGFAGLGYAGFRRSRATRLVGGLPRKSVRGRA
jgi:hypothetical protein